MTYNVFGGTLSLTQSIDKDMIVNFLMLLYCIVLYICPPLYTSEVSILPIGELGKLRFRFCVPFKDKSMSVIG